MKNHCIPSEKRRVIANMYHADICSPSVQILSEYPILKVETTPFTINATLSRQLTYTKNRHYKELGLSKPAREGKRKKQRVTVPPATPTHAQAEQEVQVQGDTAGPGCSNETVTIQEDLSHSERIFY